MTTARSDATPAFPSAAAHTRIAGLVNRIRALEASCMRDYQQCSRVVARLRRTEQKLQVVRDHLKKELEGLKDG